MSYTRVIPRDLFNESKLLKCLGRLALLIHDRSTGERCMRIVHDGRAFRIEQDQDDGGLYCANLALVVDGRKVPLRSCYNSKAPYPLVTTARDGEEIAVFDDTGNFTTEFLEKV